MHFRVTGDIDSRSGVGSIIDSLSGSTRQHFLSKNYGAGLLGVVVVLMCQDANLNLKKRVSFAKKKKKVYLDIMLDLDQMRQAEHEIRKRIVIERLAEEVPTVLRKYSIPDFDETRFVEDLRQWLKEIG